jgi:hypothetical protein
LFACIHLSWTIAKWDVHHAADDEVKWLSVRKEFVKDVKPDTADGSTVSARARLAI